MNRLVAAALAAAIALTPIASAPARAADGRDVARALAGIAALAIIGKVIENKLDDDDDDRRDRVVKRRHAPRIDSYRRHQRIEKHRRAKRIEKHRQSRRIERHRRAQRHALPGGCRVRGRGRHSDSVYFDRRCLNRHLARPGRLPAACEISVRSRHGWRAGYAPRCLRRHGYTVARR